ncbi:sporulation histidine kinase inhibitor Sda [Halalkalibacter lacteus]
MFKLKTHDLLKVYEKAIELNLEKDFIEILEVELQRRGATDLSKTWVK